ncbi:phage tail tape measure protein [Clostridium tertium]|uniref:phage tail tape measure protein n=1 Tax=Clostridium tertium TaxID=1559 RepID=UPI001C1DDCE9|nr:phage tail tape measure protein [Clostridium tertium]MBU6137352.1 phage tail tape measure protein [Clostridium tertium]
MSESIRKVSTIFTIDDNEHNKKLKEINSQYKLTQSEIKLAGDRLNQFGKNTDDLRYKQEALVKQTETLKNKINLYKDSIEKASNRAEENNKKLQELKTTKQSLQKEYKDAVKLYGEESEEAKKLKDQLDKVNAEYTEQKAVVDKNITSVNNHKVKLNEAESQLSKVQGELKKTNTELDKQNSKWIQAGESLKNAGDNISNFGERASKIGGTLTKTVTLPIVAMGTAAVNAQVKWESAFAGVKKTVDGTTEQMAELEKGIKDMSLALPSSAEDIAAVAESAGQLGIQTENILGFTKTIIDLSNATNLVGEEGASQLAKFANITQMSQKNFDRLGSTIVALGNNSATTEADIVAMAMRLAGAGHQVKMTEAQILGLAASLSSVGIEAEAGGSAFSKVMINMQLAVETGNDSLKDFASVAGMTTSEFSKAFKEDAAGALTTFIKGLSSAEEQGNSAIKVLDDMGITEVRLRDSLLRAGSASELFNDTIALGSKAWEENTALTNEANQRYATTESQIKILKNEIVAMAREIGVELLPIVKDGMIVIKDLIKKFNELSPATKENIIKLATLSATVGPVVGSVGKLAEGFGGVLKVAGKLSGKLGATKIATETVGTAAKVAGGASGVAGLASSLGGVVVAAAPYVLAGAAIAGAGYAIYKGLSQEVIPEVDLFADKIEYTAQTMNTAGTYAANSAQATVTKISEATKTAVGAYVELDDSAKNEMQSLYLNSTVISDQIKTDMTTKFSEMSTQIIAGYEKQKNDSIAQLQEMFNIQSTLTTEEQVNIITKTGTFYEDRKTQTQNYENSINQIMSTASQEKRALTEDETKQITALQNMMRENAVKALSENEVEAQVILQRMKDYDTRITAEQAGEHIRKLNESRDNAVTIANDEYEKRIATITRLRDESGVISAEQAEKMIQDAKDQRDGIVEQAENTRKEAVDKIFQMNKSLQKDVDYSTGEIISIWQKMFGTWDRWQPETKYARTVQYTERMTGNMVGNALGTSYFQGGFTEINERGYEVVELPRGSKVKNHLQSENMIKDTAIQTAKSIINGLQEILNTDKQVILMMNDRVVGEAVIPIVSNGLAKNTKTRR